jgi:hypothetical protein
VGDATAAHERIAAIGGPGGAADGVVVVFDAIAVFVAKMYPKAQLVKKPN